MSSSTSFIDPASLGFHAPSPAPSSSYTHDDDHDDDSHPRKRQRTSSKSSDESSASGKDLSLSEQRKEARAHRNRIAAQNSRDRRKAQFGYLERRVAELEEENRRLRAGVQLPPTMTSAQVPSPVFASQVTLASVLEDRLRAERERERGRENEELKARIRTLEQGWEAVVKALTAQGLPAGLGLPAATPTVTPVVQPIATLPSPAPSNASLDFEQASPLPTTAPAAPAPAPTTALAAHDQTTRHLAAGGLGRGAGVRSASAILNNAAAAVPPSTPAQKLEAATTNNNDATMEALLREILASPRAPHAAAGGVPTQGALSAGPAQVSGSEEAKKECGEHAKTTTNIPTDADETQTKTEQEAAVAQWANEIEMQRMLDNMMMLSGASPFGMDMGMGCEMDGMGLGDMSMDLSVVDMGLGMEMTELDLLGMDMGFGGGENASAGAGVGVF